MTFIRKRKFNDPAEGEQLVPRTPAVTAHGSNELRHGFKTAVEPYQRTSQVPGSSVPVQYVSEAAPARRTYY